MRAIRQLHLTFNYLVHILADNVSYVPQKLFEKGPYLNSVARKPRGMPYLCKNRKRLHKSALQTLYFW